MPVLLWGHAKRICAKLRSARAGYSPTEIRVLDAEWKVAEVIEPEVKRGLV